MEVYGYGRIQNSFWLSKKDEVRQMGDNEFMQNQSCGDISNTSIVIEEDLNHWTILGEGRPLLLLVLGLRDEIPLFLVFLFSFDFEGR